MKVIFALVLMFGVFAVPATFAQGFPNKPIRIVVPYPPGGTNDILARKLSTVMKLGVPVVVENRPGASGIIGTQYVAVSAPDGYTLLLPGSTHTINGLVSKKVLPYDPVEGFTPVSMIGTASFVLVIHPSVPAKNLREFIAHAKADPKGIKCGIVPAAAPHLATAMLASTAGITLLQVPYKGTAPMLTDLFGGHINCLMGVTTPAMAGIKDGKFRALAVTSTKRLSVLPDVPTMQELGLAGYEAESWYGVLAPKGTPPAAVKIVADELIRAVREPDVTQFLHSTGIDVIASGPKELGEFLVREVARWKAVVTAAKIVVDN